MSLAPNKWMYDQVLDFEPPASYCEGLGSLSVLVGYHKDYSSGHEIEISKTRVIRNHQGSVIRQDDERWEYEMHGAPPRGYTSSIKARPFLPDVNEGRGLREVQTIVDIYYPWSSFTPGHNLSKKRIISGFVVYDLNPNRQAITTEGEAELEARGLNPSGEAGVVVASGRSWESAIANDSMDQRTTAPQVALWREPMVTEWEEVIESIDAWRIYEIKKLHFKGGHTDIQGPRTQRKESFEYRLPVPITPPVITTQTVETGIQVRVEGGAAEWRVPVFKTKRQIHPDGYHIYRRVVSEPARTPSTDPWALYDTPPGTKARSKIIETSTVTDLSGTPASAVPTPDTYTEPGDTSPADDPGWELLAEVDNEGDKSPGSISWAVAIDTDLVNTGQYEYFAIAILGNQESEESNHETMTWGGATTGSSIKGRSRQTDEYTEIEALPPDDAGLLGYEYGEVFEFEIPALLGEGFTIEDLRDVVADRVFARADAAHTVIRVDCTMPIFPMERGQLIRLSPLSWETKGNNLILSQQVQEGEWLIQGFAGSARITDNDEWDCSYNFSAEDNP